MVEQKMWTSNYFFWRGPVGFILCHLGLPNESQHPKDQLTKFTVETFISAIYIVVFFDLSNPQPNKS